MATPKQLDEIINTHFMFEATDNIDGVVDSLAGDFVHEVIPSPVGSITDREKVHSYYSFLFANVHGESVTPIKRYYGEDFLIDETLWHGQIEDGKPFLCDGLSGPVSFRLLHVFEVKDGKITKEQAWCDLAEIQRQLDKK